MAVTALDARAALVVIDLQKGLMARPTAHPIHEIVGRAALLADAFRGKGLPVVLVTVTGSAPGRTDAGRWEPGPRDEPTPAPDADDPVGELGPRPGDVLITKQRWGAFHGTWLHERLRALGVTQVMLAGVRTSVGVESTARAAYEHGYNVVPITDAMTDGDAEAHRNSVERVFPNLGETATTDDVLALLEKAP